MTIGRRIALGAVLLAAGAAALVALLGMTARARATGGTPLLPNLVADPPTGQLLNTYSIEGRNEYLLRFNGYVHNTGPGAVDFRGERAAPTVEGMTEEEVAKAEQRAHEKEESLPAKMEAELASPPMNVSQRLFTTNVGEEETNIERAHVEEPSAGKMEYVSADGHHHWHLNHVAEYSLWNAAKTAEVAPSMKVGFCLEDSEHVETSIGPSGPIYADTVPPYREFCKEYQPAATSLFEGISPGWRDLYKWDLAYQWVNVSDVLPGEYWLQERVNPLGFVKEAGTGEKEKFAASKAVIPGFVAQPQWAGTTEGRAQTITLTSQAYADTQTPAYTIVQGPRHGTLSGASGDKVTYTPEPGYTGTDTFTFSAGDPTSQFPEEPAIATVSIEVAAASRLLTGDAVSLSSGVPDKTQVGREETFQFTAAQSGVVQELEFLTDGEPNTGVSAVDMGIFAEGAQAPGGLLGSTEISGEPPVNTWIKGTGLVAPVTAGQKYWLAVLPVGKAGAELHFDAASVESEGSGNLESDASNLEAIQPETEWTAFNQGPVDFQALGAPGAPAPMLSISGEQAQMTAGTSVSLAAAVANDSGGVEWHVQGGGSVTAEGAGGRRGLFRAPSTPGSVTVTARLADSPSISASVTIAIVAAPAPVAAPEVPGATAAALTISSSHPSVARPHAMLIGRKLVMTTRASVAGRLRLSAYRGSERIGTCVAQTPARRTFTCQLTLKATISLRAPLRIVASIRAGRLLLSSSLPARPVPEMKMKPVGTKARAASGSAFWCSPSTLHAVLVG